MGTAPGWGAASLASLGRPAHARAPKSSAPQRLCANVQVADQAIVEREEAEAARRRRVLQHCGTAPRAGAGWGRASVSKARLPTFRTLVLARPRLPASTQVAGVLGTHAPEAMSRARWWPLTTACRAVSTVHMPHEAASALPLPHGIWAKGVADMPSQSGRASMPCRRDRHGGVWVSRRVGWPLVAAQPGVTVGCCRPAAGWRMSVQLQRVADPDVPARLRAGCRRRR